MQTNTHEIHNSQKQTLGVPTEGVGDEAQVQLSKTQNYTPNQLLKEKMAKWKGTGEFLSIYPDWILMQTLATRRTSSEEIKAVGNATQRKAPDIYFKEGVPRETIQCSCNNITAEDPGIYSKNGEYALPQRRKCRPELQMSEM
jgi:hypothetical protein|mmetsp:Transcript_109101/g.185112  ORF Transcript_109101/g.185112 Transcript_109101/m.185112 type:complete len:143 (-) Transcript_109101:57-485(-)